MKFAGNKKYLAIVLVCVAVAFAAGFCLRPYIDEHRVQRPFADLTREQVLRVEADYYFPYFFYSKHIDRPPTYVLSEEETDEFVRALQGVSLKKETDIRDLPSGGTDFSYRFYTADGEWLSVSGVGTAIHPDEYDWGLSKLLSIDSHIYETDNASLETLAGIYNNCARLPQGPLTPYG